MGLDGVELILRIEDEFSISLSDDEASTVRTVGELYELVLSKLDTTASCLSSKAFYRARQALVECLQVPRRSIRPSTDLESLLPESTRIQRWQEISQTMGLQLPRLRYSRTWKTRFRTIGFVLSSVLMLGAAVSSGFAGWHLPTSTVDEVFAALLWLVLACFLGELLLRMTPSLRIELPLTTAGDMARLLLSTHYEEFSPAAKKGTTLSKEYVWKRLVDIFCDQLQINPEEVVPEANIAQDLGVD